MTTSDTNLRLGQRMLATLLLVLAACQDAPTGGYQGYLEADYAYVGAALAGRLTALPQARGARVEAGALLYALDDTLERQQLVEAESRLAQARAQRADLSQGRRPEEIRVISARVREARSALALAEAELKRTRELSQRGLAPPDALDRAQAAQAQAQARVASAMAEESSAALAGRPDAQAAADAAIAAAEALVAQARWRVQQMRVTAEAAGQVVDQLYQVGEWVPAGAPVLKLLPAQGPYARFYVPLAELAEWTPGVEIAVGCSGCPAGLRARVSFIAPAPEYTPPVIYSESRSDDLVYRVEASFDQPVALAPGLPVTVRRP